MGTPHRESRPLEWRPEEVLVERFAAHFPGAVVKGPEVTLPFGGLTVSCEAADLGRMGAHHTASLFETGVRSIKVNGGDWLPGQSALLDLPSAAGDDIALLRELAVAVPLSPAPLIERAAPERTLSGLAASPEGMPRDSVTWRGFRAPGGFLLRYVFVRAGQLSDFI